ncbi:MAG: DNA (cytosine-5-)-methyltransferase [bacterium]|nr:DNA (cytosine-5-)-methyltransferase [bacterium]
MVYISTKKASDILGVSPTTMRRYADAGSLPVVRLSQSRHRRFAVSDVSKLLTDLSVRGDENGFHKKNSPSFAKPHPSHYLLHKYWGRKAHNIVENYVKRYTRKGDVVLDPFMGSGVVLIESAKAHRKAIGIDINPLSKFIVDGTTQKVNPEELAEVFGNILSQLEAAFEYYNMTKCLHCRLDSTIETTVWNETEPAVIRFRCPVHGVGVKVPSQSDKRVIREARTLFEDLEAAHELQYPKDEILKYVKRSGVSTIDALFTSRALVQLSHLLILIEKVEVQSVRDTLKLIFSSMLPNVSKMIPGDIEKGTYKSGWVISKFWVPKIHTERSVLHCLKLRFQSVFKGKKELKDLDESLIQSHIADSKKLALDDNSVDYIFTDPPYGESIAYLALSHFYNAWFKMLPEYSNEIIIDPYRKISKEDFARNIQKCFGEMYRVLKPNRFLSFTFHNRNLDVWKTILEACLKSGFTLKDIVFQPQAVSSGTQGINRKNTLYGDFIYTFQKPKKKKIHEGFKYFDNAYGFLVNTINSLLVSKGQVSTAELYEHIIPIIVKNHAYLDKDGKIIDLETLISNNFEYKKTEKGDRWRALSRVANTSRFTVVDLFAGAGGFSEGFKHAGFDIAVAVENDSRHSETYVHNHPNTRLIVDGVENISTSKRRGRFSISEFLRENHKSCNIIIGGPPCQGFSMAGSRIRRKRRFLSDRRNTLFLEYVNLVEDLNPEVFILENVPGILNYDNGAVKEEIISKFAELGYDVHAEILDASKYGIPQSRKRAFFIGNRLGIPSKTLFPNSQCDNETVSVWDAISDLPQIMSGEGGQVIKNNMMVPQSHYQQIMRLENEDCIFNHEAPTHSQATLDVMKLIKPGKGLKDLPKEFHTRSVHSGAYGRMEKDRPAFTLTTRLNTPSVGRITHPVLHRTITPREAARLQSFSDSYRFFGDVTTQGIQIGNAVPPLLAELIAKEIMKKAFDR